MSHWREKPSDHGCVCSHHRSEHVKPERFAQGYGACSRLDCACVRFQTRGQKRYTEYLRQRAAARKGA